MPVLAHGSRFGKLRNELENNYTKGKDEYPKSFDKCYSMLYYIVEKTRKQPSKHSESKKTSDNGVLFNTNAKESELEDDVEGE